MKGQCTFEIEAHLAWCRLRGLRPATVVSRRNALRRLQTALLDKYSTGLLEADRDQLKEWQENRQLTAVGMNIEVMHIACFYRWAYQEADLIEVDPATRLIRPRFLRGLPRPMAEPTLALAIDQAPPDIRLILVLAAYCGLRAGELSRLQRSDFLDTTPPLVRVDGKGGKERMVPLSQRVLMELHAYGAPSRGPLIARRDGRPGGNSPARMSQMTNAYLREHGIRDTLHSCRHRFGTRVYAGMPDIRVVQELMGHSDPATTAGYVAYSQVKAVEAVELLGNDSRPIVGAPSSRF